MSLTAQHDVQTPATQRDIAQVIDVIALPAIHTGPTVALPVDRAGGRALIDLRTPEPGLGRLIHVQPSPAA
ncbi:hypothetical protein INH39_26855 [Massilia violaceinigra]|uniref:Uncharacterized protein n=1 Tax=Massilia violaceinigra TaxID=2045208 RepID=A0ABY4A2M8_9BURK|nr:hypothetical protein [Massilia violaceinigra]UOD29013.1 hypothetical protein INH39_26855 [Massilia violaceinigra]